MNTPTAIASNGSRAEACGQLAVAVVSGQSAAVSVRSTNPLKILVPQPRGPSVWAYVSSFGGGLVAGDRTRLDLRIETGARGFVGTQASTKIYRNPLPLACSHETHATVGAGGLLVFAPETVQPFADSAYTQRQEFHLAADAGIALVDWFTSGRAARGERWAFRRFQSRNDVFVEGERVFLDSLLLDSRETAMAAAHRTGRYDCFATLLFLGPLLRQATAQLLDAVSARPVGRRASLVFSASPIRDGAVLRVAGEHTEAVAGELHSHLKTLAGPLGDDPWSRKW